MPRKDNVSAAERVRRFAEASSVSKDPANSAADEDVIDSNAAERVRRFRTGSAEPSDEVQVEDAEDAIQNQVAEAMKRTRQHLKKVWRKFRSGFKHYAARLASKTHSARAPKGTTATFEQAQQFFNAGRYAEAVRILEELVRRTVTDLETWALLGAAYWHIRAYNRAKRTLKKVLKGDEAHAFAHYYLGLTYDRQGEPIYAYLHYQCVMQFHPEGGEATKKAHAKLVLMETYYKVVPLISTFPCLRSYGEPFLLMNLGSAALATVYGYSGQPAFLITAGAWYLAFWIVLFISSRTSRIQIYMDRLKMSYGIIYRDHPWIEYFKAYQAIAQENLWLDFFLRTSRVIVLLRQKLLIHREFRELVSISSIGNIKHMHVLQEFLSNRIEQRQIQVKGILTQ